MFSVLKNRHTQCQDSNHNRNVCQNKKSGEKKAITETCSFSSQDWIVCKRMHRDSALTR